MSSNLVAPDKLLQVSQAITRAMINDLHLSPPAQFAWTQYNGRTWMLAALPRESLGRATETYFDSKALRHLSDITGVPVTANRRALMYLVLLSDRPRLPKYIEFPASPPPKDVFEFGVSLRGNVAVSAATMENVMIGATQNAGKSNILKILTHTARFNGWPLYLADPQGHTYNPDVWNSLAVAPVARSGADLKQLIGKVDGELKNREALYRQAAQKRGGVPPENIEKYNQVSEQTLSRFMLAIDEANDFLEDKSIEGDLTRLAREGRKYGLHLVVAAHNWRDSRGRGVSREFSGRMTTRISLKVSDDTSGDVVLESLRWGKWVLHQPQGRGVIRLSGKHIPLQFYYIPEATEAVWLANTQQRIISALTDNERGMVEYATKSLNGEFNLREISEQFGVTMWKVRKLAETWEQCGWLNPPADAISSRKITDKLLDLAGISRTGAQVAQGHTGTAQAAQGHTGPTGSGV